MLLSAKWVLPITSPPIADGAVMVTGDRIEAVGRLDELKKKHPGEPVRDFGEAVILPGFVDLHTHLEYSAFRGLCDDLDYTDWKIQVTRKAKPLKKRDWLASARLGALEALASGITCIADITGSGASLEAAKEAGLRGVVYYEITGMDHSGSAVERIVMDGRETVSQWQAIAEGTLLGIGVAPHSPYSVAPPLFRAVSRWTRYQSLPVCMHLAGSEDEYAFVKYGSGKLATTYRDVVGWSDYLWQPLGTSPVKYLEEWEAFEGQVMAVHCVQVDEDDLDILAANEVSVAYCPKCSAKWGMGTAPLSSFMHHGLRVGIGTDSPASNNTMDFFDEMRMGLLLQRASTRSVEETSASRFIEFATLGGATALRMEREIGSLEDGKQADLIAVDLSSSRQKPVADPYSALVYTANQENVILTMVAGQTFFEGGAYLTLDQASIEAATEPVRAKLGRDKTVKQ